MKNIIAIAAILAAGTATGLAESKGYNSLSESQKTGVIVAWDFSNGTATPVAGSSTWNTNNSFTLDGNKATLTSSSNHPYKTGLGSSFSSGDFTLSFDIYSFTANNWQAMVSLYSNNTTYGDGNSLQVGVNTSGELQVFNKVGGAAAFAGIDTNGNLSTGLKSGFSGQTTLTLVSDMSSSKEFTVYVNGAKVASYSNWTASSNQSLTGIQFGSAFGGKRVFPNAEIGNITLWNKALSQSEVGLLIVPEPSAFGLLAGAGALVLVAARRRRRAK